MLPPVIRMYLFGSHSPSSFLASLLEISFLYPERVGIPSENILSCGTPKLSNSPLSWLVGIM